ncbi:MAG: xanthine dehydrogenase family protein subunit M [Chloroflexi bacterium]|nr:xanthine dehydrogenase family protein subunit M [Chloroflexota bacterium]
MTSDTHPALPEFEYVQPQTLNEASEFLSNHANEARPFLGGTDVFVRMRDGFLSPKYLVDVKNLSGMSLLTFDPQSGLTVGAAVNMNRIIASPEVQAHYPLLVKACRSVASYQLRTRATIIGNICNASPAGDVIGACLVLGGILHIHGINGSHEENLSAFFLGPGKTTLEPGDIVTAIHFPLPPQKCSGTYIKLGRNQLSDLSIVGVTAFGYKEPTCASGYRFRLALASVAPLPLMPTEVETHLAEHPISAEAIHEAARLASEACTPIDDVRGSARYRKEMVRNLSEKALTEVWKKLG